MHISRPTASLLLALLAGSGTAAAQDQVVVRRAYFRAVADFFQMPSSEVAILGEWRLPPEEVPVVLFVARRAGVSPEAVVSLRRSGRGWAELAGRYQLDASHFYVPLGDSAPAGILRGAYDQYRALPASRWGEVRLRDRDIVDLVNLRLVSQSLRIAPERVIARATGAEGWDRIYRELVGGQSSSGAAGPTS